jgi:serine protease AprX
MQLPARRAGVLVLSLFLAFGSAVASAAAHIDPVLAQRLAAGPGPHQVVITFKRASDAGALSGLGVHFIPLTQLPVAGAVLTTPQVNVVKSWPSVESVYFNAPLRYSNYTSGEITGGHYVHDSLGLKGAGATIAVLDSGIDANHPDLAFGSKVVQNVKLVGDLGLSGVSTFIENVPNTDTSSGHGTHVSGTVGGTGAASATDARRPYFYAGIAPEASLIGLGAGEGLSIFHALLGFEWALDNQQRYGIDVITNSWGGGDGAAFDPSNPINQASYEAYRRGMVVTFAASNSGPDDNTLSQYAIAPWVINVAAGTANKGLADFSSRGVAGDDLKHPDITAPGNEITSTRAPGTAVGAMGPVVDPNHPEYTLRYHTISGTSMATPFVAGTVALLLGANPQLSPDQIEQNLAATADAMPGHLRHQVGAGYIDVREAVEQAIDTAGTRVAFLAGDTAWSRQGAWNTIADGDSRLRYLGNWRVQNATTASDGSYRTIGAKTGGSLRALFTGTALKISFPTNAQGGIADVYVDGVKRGTVSFYSAAAGRGIAPVVGLTPGSHTLELRAIKGNSYVDGLLLEGALFHDNTSFIDESRTDSGTMGPSAADLEIDRYTIDAGSDATTLKGRLAWTGALDLDLYLVDPQGTRVASAATTANPETFEFTVAAPGTYTIEVTGFATVAATYTLTSTVTRAVTSP